MTTTTRDRWQRLREIFAAASQLPRFAVSAYLDEECAQDPEMRREVEALLAEDAQHPDGLENAVQQAAEDLTAQWAAAGFEVGDTLGKYHVVGRLGEGGMGEVYIADDTELGRKVALKVITGATDLHPEKLQRLQREARALASLNHPNIVTIYAVEHMDDIHFLAMELVEGKSLDRTISPKGLGIDEFFALAIPLAEALAAAHEHGVTHRDLKPANIMQNDRGEVKILDFGLAKLRQKEGASLADAGTKLTLTQAGVVMGTVPYMSPEQAEGKPLDHRTDIFSLGAVFYEMTTGARPFQGDSSAALISSILTASPEPVTSIRRDLPPRLAQIIARCLEKAREQRYQNAAELARELTQLRDALAHHPRLASGFTRASALVPRGRKTRMAALSALALIILIGLIVGLAWINRQEIGSPGAPRIASLAVLPLANLSGDPQQEYLADGMTEILITELSQIGALKVISRTSVMRFKNTEQSMAEIARQLGVDAVVEGSVLQSENRVRVTAQLIHGPSDEHLWADSFERDLRDLFALQGEVARAIAQQVEVTLTPEEQARLTSGKTVDPRASEAYLRGRNYWNNFDFVSAVKAFQEAIDLEPEFARAWAGLAHARQMQGVNSFPHPPKFANAEAKKAIARALELDDESAEAHAVKGFIALNFDWEWQEAERQFARAIELNPGESLGHTGMAYLHAALGRFEEAEASATLARELDPLAPMANVTVAEILYYARQFDRALFQLGEQWEPSFRPTHWLQSRILQATGDPNAAAWSDLRAWQTGSSEDQFARFENALRTEGPIGYWGTVLDFLTAWPQEAILAKYVAEVHVRLGEHDLALDWLERSLERRDALAPLGVDPIWDPLRSNPRFEGFRLQMQLPQLNPVAD